MTGRTITVIVKQRAPFSVNNICKLDTRNAARKTRKR